MYPAPALRRRQLRALVCVSLVAVLGGAAGTAQEARLGAPAHLRCEYLVDPLGIDDRKPRLSWVNRHANPRLKNVRQSAYRVLVSDEPRLLAGLEGNLWDSGKVSSRLSAQIVYAGNELASRARCYWRVRVWDENDIPSPWSRTARWTMGLLDPAEWNAMWIGDATPDPQPAMIPAHNGYHSGIEKSPDTPMWVTLDLGRERRIDTIKLWPARPFDWKRDEPGFLFPLRFKIEAAETSDFAKPWTLVDRTAQDQPRQTEGAAELRFQPAKTRFVRLLVTKLRARENDEYGFALAELEVLGGGTNVAKGAAVSAKTAIENSSWSAARLCDGNVRPFPGRGIPPLPAPMLRREVRIRGAVERATAYVTALGLYELRINGKKVGNRVLAPEWTDYHRRVQYQTYDVTAHLRSGRNAIGAVLGAGWYAGRIGLSGIVPGGNNRAIYGRHPRLLLRIEIDVEGGGRQVVLSNERWRSTHTGPIQAADILDGEAYDARREMDGWDEPGFDDARWTSAKVYPATDARIVAQPNQPIRVTRTLRPIAVRPTGAGAWTFDMGQNMVGWCRLKVRGKRGTVITLRHAEMLDEAGHIYTANLRSAAQTDAYVLRGTGELEVWEPRFTYHGFRYVQVSGLTEQPTLETIAGRVVHSAAPEVGRFECSNALLNKLWRNILWTQRANMHSTPTDCPQRDERLGWMGDILAFRHTACFNMDMAAFIKKWIVDVRDAQTDDGRYPDFAPHPFGPAERFSGVPAWGDAGVFVPWAMYEHYGDRRVLAEHFRSAQRWIDWIASKNPDHLWKNARHNDYGDWLNADTLKLNGWPQKGAEVPKDVFATMFFAKSADLVRRIGAFAGRADASGPTTIERLKLVARLEGLAQKVEQAFQKTYITDGKLEGDTQAGYAIALDFGLVPGYLQEAFAKRMVERFAPYDGHVSTGFHSTVCLMNMLSRYGYNDEAYRLALKRSMPSWGYAIDHGATTIWERWDGWVEGRGFQDPNMNSFAHYAIGSVGEWMYRTVLGIDLPSGDLLPAFRHVVIRPQPGGDLTWARGHHDSIHGRIRTEWKRDGDRFALTVEVPANTTASIVVPTRDPESITIDGKPGQQWPRFATLPNGGDCVLPVGSGIWKLTSTLR